jgi:hypothetical protein
MTMIDGVPPGICVLVWAEGPSPNSAGRYDRSTVVSGRKRKSAQQNFPLLLGSLTKAGGTWRKRSMNSQSNFSA